MSVDPLTASYPSWSPYPFAMNRPIDGVDLDGKEWDRETIVENNNQQTVIVKVNVEFLVDASLNLTEMQLNTYKEAIVSQFKRTFEESSSGLGTKFTAEITFMNGSPGTRKNDENNQAIPRLEFLKTQPGVMGVATPGEASVGINSDNGGLRSPGDVAIDAIHELLHTLRIKHPFEVTQSPDCEMVRVGINQYGTTPNTDPNIAKNIMNYPSISVDGQLIESCYQYSDSNLLTKGQLNKICNEIDLQKQGCGNGLNGDTYRSEDEEE